MKTKDISFKYETKRIAIAEGKIFLGRKLIQKILENKVEKGNVLEASKLAGIIGAKKTSDLLPFCHPIPIDHIEVHLEVLQDSIIARAKVIGIWRTGYEMEALNAVSVALLNIYDMCKAFKEPMHIEYIKLVDKKGGYSDYNINLKDYTFAIITISDSSYRRKRKDLSGKLIKEIFENLGSKLVFYTIVPDNEEKIKQAILEAKSKGANIILTTGGTGLSFKDVTPEVTEKLIKKEIPGLEEAIRIFGTRDTLYSLLSRAKIGFIDKHTLIINLPGNPKAVKENLEKIIYVLDHAFKMARGEGHKSEE